ncbi:hypothetical protein S40285_07039 [Stachybotrys chlorohalonatus IBT 40285]|uniref:Uncharacterized protein n=1 Tax=Stachybotrys chlorohalonatus (strain IBT 40285) TaxID=1283841 RepID=A0A084QS57_STAC4|nr:hypothetical protein S40285_07039 [Stachybotrys chlorohalonata IBT 40285]
MAAVDSSVFDFLLPRELRDFPSGDNSSDAVWSGTHFNLTTLNFFNYSYYSNETVSNGSRCYLTFSPYIEPAELWPNGTWTNATRCYVAINPIRARGLTGIGFAVAFGIGLVLTLTALAKHGRIYLPVDRRFYPIGRRWQWYWASFVCAFALISLLLNVDVDRYYLQETPLIVTVFTWFLICNGTVAIVWEAVRHWGSWQERQYTDPNPFTYSVDDRRAKTEFYLPLWFYFWNWMNFFLCIPRNWTFLQRQSDDDQFHDRFIPNATSNRFKAGSFCLIVCWLTICFSMHHSIHYYRPSEGGFFRRIIDYLRSFPARFLLIVPLCAGLIAYQVYISFDWRLSLMVFDGNVPVMFGWGYGPPLAIIWIQVLYGYFSPNEDKELIRQRRERGEHLDRELGIVRRPAWWSRVRGDHLLTLRDKILRNVHEVGTERGAGRRTDLETDAERIIREEARRAAASGDEIEMNLLLDPHNPRVDRAGVRDLQAQTRGSGTTNQPLFDDYADPYAPPISPAEHADAEPEVEEPFKPGPTVFFPNYHLNQRAERHAWLMEDGPPPPPYSDRNRSGNDRRSSASTTGSLNAPPQQVRSMLDI